MLGGLRVGTFAADDIRFVLNLGLVSQSGRTERLAIANPIYRELIARELTATTRASLPALKPVWLGDDGRIRLNALLTAFLSFWRLHGEPLLGTSAYSEIAPHIVLMAFLQRVVSGGTVDREFAIGRGCMDLLVRHRDVTLAVELKTWRDSDRKRDVVAEGLAQLDEYLAAVDADSAWLVLFDQRTGQPPIAERTSSETTVTPGGRPVTLVRA